MKILQSIVNWYFKQRYKKLEYHYTHPIKLQHKTLSELLERAAPTQYGQQFNFASIKNYEQFKNSIPINTYESLQPLIEKAIQGEQNVLWAGEINWFAKSSGTTSARSKFIPVTYQSLEDCHFKGGRDVLSFYCHNFPESKIFSGKGLTMGGSHKISPLNKNAYVGDVSAVMMENMPFLGQLFNTPPKAIALMDNWEKKIDYITKATLQENVTMLIGVPSWTLVLINHILEITGAEHINEIWADLELFIHGGVSFTPYENQYQQLLNHQPINYVQTYNASEGFFAIQDLPNRTDMLLMLDYGIFYEFYDAITRATCSLEEVVIGKIYSIIISTNGGLWRYKIGDTVCFTSTKPYRLKVVGRDVQFINAFGEEVIVDNTDKAIATACKITGAEVREYTAAPVFMNNQNSGRHEWLIEFAKEPSNINIFSEELDLALQSLNSDYAAKRTHNLVLDKPLIHLAKYNTFYNWLKQKNKLGGQHKIPRLANNRIYLEEILQIEQKLIMNRK